MPESVATRGNWEIKTTYLYTRQYSVPLTKSGQGLILGRLGRARLLVLWARVEAILVGCPIYLAQTVLRVSKPGQRLSKPEQR